MRLNLLLPLLLLITISLFSCKKGGEDDHDAEMRRLKAWMKVHNIDATPTASGMYIIPVQEGNGDAPVDLDYAYINYSVEQLDGTITYSTDSLVADNWGLAKRYYAPELTRLGLSSSNQPGIAEAIWHMKVGGKVRLVMPSNLAYGVKGVSSSVGNPLVLNLELVSVFADIAKNEKDSVVKYKTKYSLTETIAGKDGIYYKPILQQDTCKGKYLKDYASSVKVWYVGRFLNGYIFDTNIDSVATKAGITVSSTNLFNVEFGKSAIPAFEEVVKNMWLQEKTTLVTTSEFAYGASGTKDAKVPSYTPLVFEITIDKTYVKK